MHQRTKQIVNTPLLVSQKPECYNSSSIKFDKQKLDKKILCHSFNTFHFQIRHWTLDGIYWCISHFLYNSLPLFCSVHDFHLQGQVFSLHEWTKKKNKAQITITANYHPIFQLQYPLYHQRVYTGAN